MALLKMRNTVQHYAWGSPTVLPRMLGLPNPKGEPIAEIWMGAHAKASSSLLLPEGEVPLVDLVEDDPDRWMGPAVAARFGGEFPFLLKLLSAETALSIQAHPSKLQAQEGYVREDRQGVPQNAPERNYRDRNHKPELMLPLTEFFALCGFREPGEIRENLSPYLRRLSPSAGAIGAPRPGGLEAWFKGWLRLPKADKDSLLQLVVQDAPANEDLASPLWWVAELNRQYPGDFGALSPLFLNLLRLAPREAIFLGPGVLHAYLRGAGVEVMANSDNVLRAGCTVKHVDPEELLRVLSFDGGGVAKVAPLPVEEGVELFRTPAEEFEILRLSLGAESRQLRRNVTNRAPLLMLCTEGGAQIGAEEIESPRLAPGESLFVTPGTATVELSGPGVVYCATVAGAFEG